MRKVVVACLVGLLAVNGAIVTNGALAQQQQGSGKQKEKTRPPPPPAPRCPDLGVGTIALVSELPGQPPLADGEIAITYAVRNDGNALYSAVDAEFTSVALEYTTPAGATRVAAAPAITAVNEDGHIVLSFGHSVRGSIRAVLPAAAQGRRLRLRLVYASEGTRSGIPDCNENNNTVNVVRPTPTP